MKRLSFVFLTVVMLSASLAMAVTAEEIITRNLEARGGLERIKAVESLRAVGVMNVAGMEAPCVMEWKRPNKMRLEMNVKDRKGVQAYDGETAWAWLPFMGINTPTKRSAEESLQVKEASYFWGPLVDWKERGYTVVYEGDKEIDGVICHELMVTNPMGDVSYLYIDEVYNLQVREVQLKWAEEQEIRVTIDTGDYREVDGLFIPFAQKQKIKTTIVESTLTFEEVELNVDIPDEQFAMPATTPAAEETTETKSAGS